MGRVVAWFDSGRRLERVLGIASGAARTASARFIIDARRGRDRGTRSSHRGAAGRRDRHAP